jgi:hypothetical protein
METALLIHTGIEEGQTYQVEISDNTTYLVTAPIYSSSSVPG